MVTKSLYVSSRMRAVSRDLASCANASKRSGAYVAPVCRYDQRVGAGGIRLPTGLFGLTRAIALVLSVKSDSQSSTFG